MGEATHMLSDETDSTTPRMLSISAPSEPSFLRAAAVTREASWPPCGNFTFLSCEGHGASGISLSLSHIRSGAVAELYTCAEGSSACIYCAEG